MKKILFVRGMGGDDEQCEEITTAYLTFLKARLKYILKPYHVDVAFLDGTAKKERWMKILNEIKLEDYDVVIGHSSGVQALMKCAETRELKKVILLAATAEHNNVASEIETGWYDEPWDYLSIRNNCEKIVICNGGKDHFITSEEGRNLAKNLRCKFLLFKEEGHLTEWSHTHRELGKSGIMVPNTILKRIIDHFT